MSKPYCTLDMLNHTTCDWATSLMMCRWGLDLLAYRDVSGKDPGKEGWSEFYKRVCNEFTSQLLLRSKAYEDFIPTQCHITDLQLDCDVSVMRIEFKFDGVMYRYTYYFKSARLLDGYRDNEPI